MCNLGANTRSGDESFAEFFSTFTPWFLNCHELLNRLEELKEDTQQLHHVQMRKRARDSEIVFYNIVDIYGCRPADDSLLYLSPFEFTMWWEVCSLQAPPYPEEAAAKVISLELRLRFGMSSLGISVSSMFLFLRVSEDAIMCLNDLWNLRES